MIHRTRERGGWIIAGLLALMCIALLPDDVRGGPLDPPEPPGSTRPLAEPRIPISSVPFTADAPGSYFLTRHLTMAGSDNGITIIANDVTIDLNGFTLRGPGVAFVSQGIAGTGLRNITIKNGVVENFWTGLNLYQVDTSRVERITVRLYANLGIDIGASSIVEDCIFDGGGTAAGGISVSNRTVVRRCAVLGHLYAGIIAKTYAVIEDNDVFDNDINDSSAGIYAVDNDVVIRNNRLRNAGGRDVQVASGLRAVIIDNVVSDCASMSLLGAGFDFAPLQGQRHSNITRSQGYCP